MSFPQGKIRVTVTTLSSLFPGTSGIMSRQDDNSLNVPGQAGYDGRVQEKSR